MKLIHRLLRFLAPMAILATSIAPMPAAAESDDTRENLMVVVRESIGANKQDDAFEPFGRLMAKMPDGREVVMDLAWWRFIGDMQVRFVFDGPQAMKNASRQDLARLDVLDFDHALALAMANLERVYGAPTASPWTGGVMEVHGKSPDLDSSYVLDRHFWSTLLKEHPDGVVVAVPKRGGLLYAPLSDQTAVAGLRKGIGMLYTTSGHLRVSSALYLFKDDRWSVFQPPIQP